MVHSAPRCQPQSPTRGLPLFLEAGSFYRMSTARGIPELVLARCWVKHTLTGLQRGVEEGEGMGGRAGKRRAQAVSTSQDVLTALPQLCSPRLLAACPPVQGATPPSSSHERLPAMQAGWFGTHVFWPPASWNFPEPSGKCPGPAPQVTALLISPLPPALAFLLSFLPIWQPQAPKLTVGHPSPPPEHTPQTEALGTL